MKERNDFSTGKLFPMILKYSVPAAISLLITAIYNIVDRVFVGNFNGTSALAGLSICFPLFYMMMAFGLTCSAGGSSLFSLFAGKGEQQNMNRAFGNSLILVVVFELLLTAFLLLFADPILQVFGVTETAYEYALAYYRIVALGCLFQGLSQVFCDFVRVSGKPIMGMCVTAIGAVTNIILDAVFVAGLDWGVTGAAWATVIGQLLSTLFGAYLVWKGHTKVEISAIPLPRCLAVENDHLLRLCLLDCQMAMGLISLVYNSQLGQYGGDTAISVYAVVSSMMTFVIMPASGISQGIQPLSATTLAPGITSASWPPCIRLRPFPWPLPASSGSSSWSFPKPFGRPCGASEDMMAIGVPGLRANFCITPILGFVMLVTTFFQSIAKPAPSIVITFLRQILFLIPLIYILPLVWDINGIFMAQPVSDALALIISIFFVVREKRHLYGLLNHKGEASLMPS